MVDQKPENKTETEGGIFQERRHCTGANSKASSSQTIPALSGKDSNALMATSKSILSLALTQQYLTTLTTSTPTSIVRSRRLYRSASPTVLRKLFKQQSNMKAAGPDNDSTFTLKQCVNELAPVFCDIFDASQSQIVPVCFKAATIIPVRRSQN